MLKEDLVDGVHQKKTVSATQKIKHSEMDDDVMQKECHLFQSTTIAPHSFMYSTANSIFATQSHFKEILALQPPITKRTLRDSQSCQPWRTASHSDLDHSSTLLNNNLKFRVYDRLYQIKSKDRTIIRSSGILCGQYSLS